MKFSERMWQKIQPIYQRIVDLPFNKELEKGILDKAIFCYYIEQDVYYLLDFARALALIAARAENSEIMSDFLNFSQDALVAEREVIHSHYLTLFKYKNSNEITPSCFCYSNFLVRHAAISSIEVAVSAVLPCFWIYQKLARNMQSTSDNPYQKWIEEYASKEFENVVQKAISLVDFYASGTSMNILNKMEEVFIQSTQMEWHFWNDCYNKKTIAI